EQGGGVRRDEQRRGCERGEREPRATVPAESAIDPAKPDERGAEDHRPVQVAPDGEQRQAPEDATRRPPRVLDEQPEAGDERQVGEALRPYLPRAADQAEERERQQQDHAPLRRAAPPGDDER